VDEITSTQLVLRRLVSEGKVSRQRAVI
jgi:hypothetical protein